MEWKISTTKAEHNFGHMTNNKNLKAHVVTHCELADLLFSLFSSILYIFMFAYNDAMVYVIKQMATRH